MSAPFVPPTIAQEIVERFAGRDVRRRCPVCHAPLGLDEPYAPYCGPFCWAEEHEEREELLP